MFLRKTKFQITSDAGRQNRPIDQAALKPAPLVGYVDVGTVTIKTDKSAITDEEVPYLIMRGLEKAMSKNKK